MSCNNCDSYRNVIRILLNENSNNVKINYQDEELKKKVSELSYKLASLSVKTNNLEMENINLKVKLEQYEKESEITTIKKADQ